MVVFLQQMSPLPVELIIYILELSYFRDDRLPDRKTLRSCSRVCTLWRDPAQQLLFRSVRLNRNKHPLSYLKFVFGNPVRGRMLGTYVRSLTVSVAPSEHCIAWNCYDPEEFFQLLTFFPRLYDLCIHPIGLRNGFDADNTYGFHIAAKNSSFPRNIRSLKLTPGCQEPSLICNLLVLWPSIQFLSVSLPSHLPTPPERPNFKLCQLDLQSFPNSDLLHWLAPHQSLKMASLGFAFDPREIKSFLTQQGQHLRSLRLCRFTMDTAPLLKLCPHLEDLKITFVEGRAMDETVNFLPKSLEHIQFDQPHFPLKLFHSTVRSLPKLRVITLSWKMKKWTGSRRDAVKQFEQECVERNVIPIYESSEGYPVADDPVMVERFPRGQSVFNFRLMN